MYRSPAERQGVSRSEITAGTERAATSRGLLGGVSWPALVVVALLVAAVLAPPVKVSASLVNLRVELLLWAAMPPWLAWVWLLPALRDEQPLETARWQIAGWRRLGLTPVDLGLFALALVTLLSIVNAWLVLGEPASVRDLFEVVKLGLYWTAFRCALLVAARANGRWMALGAVLLAGVVSALLGLAQYFDWFGIAGGTAHWWAEAHHVRELERDGRALGTVGNPNYFGALMAVLAVAAVHLTVSRRHDPRLPWWLTGAAAVLGTLGVVLSGSRGALVLLVVAMAVSVGVAAVLRSVREMLPVVAAVAVALLLSVTLVQAAPRGREDYLTRVAGAFSPRGDSAVALRLERWRSALFGSNSRSDDAGATEVQIRQTGLPPADAPTRERDAVRRADLQTLVAALAQYRQTVGVLPPGPSLEVLEPVFVPRLPADPATGAAYHYERTAAGYIVAATLENPADPDYPLLATGEVRNYIENGSLEHGDADEVDGFRTIPGTVFRPAAEAALLGERGLIFEGSREARDRRAAVYQQRAFGRALAGPLTASVWVKFPALVQGEVFLYTNVFYGDGDRADPYARVAADSTAVGVWQRLSIVIEPEPGRRVDFVGVYLLSDDFQGEVWADGVQLVEGRVPVTAAGLREAEPAATPGLDVAEQLRRSPVFGAGPRKAVEESTLDNEYLLVAGRYGVLGLGAYLLLWGTLVVMGLRAARRGNRPALGVVGIVAGLAVFSLVAGSLYQMQLMAVFWPLAGLLLGSTPPARE